MPPRVSGGRLSFSIPGMSRTAIALVLSALVLGCARKAAPPKAAESGASGKTDAAALASHQPIVPAGAAQAAPESGPRLTGTVLESMNAAGYTYLRLKTAEGGEVWAAVNETKVNKGDQVTIQNPMMMTDFESKTLGRKFPKIYFGTLPGGPAAAAPPAGAGAAAAPAQAAEMTAQHSAAATGPADVGPIKVSKAEGPEGHTVAALFEKKAALKDAKVAVRGKVVKFTPGVMGKNWIHLRDGTGLATNGTNDILVTTKDETRVGDVILIKGVVRTDVDLGSGYNYAVLVEEAGLKK